MLGETSPTVHSAFVTSSIPKSDDRECYNCGKKGHLSYNCLQPHNPGCGQGGGRGQRGGRRGRENREHVGDRGAVHMAITEESQGTVEMTKAEVAELEELRKFKKHVESLRGQSTTSQQFDDTTSYGNFVDYAHMDSGELSEFASYVPKKNKSPGTVQTADGTSQPIKG